METAKLIADVTATPTTKSTGRDASAPVTGSTRTTIFAGVSLIATALIAWLTGAVEVRTGTTIGVDAAAMGGAVALAVLWIADYVRRRAADIVVEAKHAAATE